LSASWPLVCDVIKRSRKRIKMSKSRSCRVSAGNRETSNGTPLVAPGKNKTFQELLLSLTFQTFKTEVVFDHNIFQTH
jgi:hypothetical protein